MLLRLLFRLIFFCSLALPVYAGQLQSLDVKKQVFFILRSTNTVLRAEQLSSGNYRLTLKEPMIAYFYDRPWKKEGVASMNELLVTWKTTRTDFGKKTDPNATWTIESQGRGAAHLINLIIHDIKLDTKQVQFVVSEMPPCDDLTPKKYKFDCLRDHVNKTIENSVLFFTLP